MGIQLTFENAVIAVVKGAQCQGFDFASGHGNKQKAQELVHTVRENYAQQEGKLGRIANSVEIYDMIINGNQPS